jgi:hypothetical protein
MPIPRRRHHQVVDIVAIKSTLRALPEVLPEIFRRLRLEGQDEDPAIPGMLPRQGIVNLFVRGYHMAYKSDDRTSLRPYAAIGVPVISRQIWNLWAISWRYSEAGNRWRLGRKCWAIGP